ncbi:MAG: hypothetical protein QOJ80_555 [Mycobacterium sp.]|nr:hypothetical protein [Mycobacterium sp.]
MLRAKRTRHVTLLTDQAQSKHGRSSIQHGIDE